MTTYVVLPEDVEMGAEIRARVINLTPHVVRLLERRPGGGFALLADLDPVHPPARVTMRLGVSVPNPTPLLDADSSPAGLGFETRAASEPGEVTGLPTPQEGRWYVVSTLVAQALRGQGRRDVYSVGTGPEDLERKDGQVWGCYALEQAPQ